MLSDNAHEQDSGGGQRQTRINAVNPPLLTIENLCVQLSSQEGAVPLLQMSGFSIAQGEAVALVGPSGSGKSLTALSLMGLLPPNLSTSDETSIRFLGKELTKISEKQWLAYRGGQMAMVFQDPATALNPVLRVGYQLCEVLALHRPELEQDAQQKMAAELLAEVGLREPQKTLRRYSFELSGGQRQRVMLALALAGEPQLLIADEPTTALDPVLKAKILDLVNRIRRERGLALLWISHDLALVRHMSDRVVLLNRTGLVEDAPTNDLFEKPQASFSQEWVSASKLPRGDFRKIACDGNQPVLRVNQLSVKYPAERNWFGMTRSWSEAVRDVTFEVNKGEVLALVGESGSGKSTIGRAVMGLLPQARGQVFIEPQGVPAFDVLARPATELRPLRKHFALVFQDPVSSLDPRMSIRDSIAQPLEIHGTAKGDALRQEVDALLLRVGLELEQGDALPGALSGGQCQRAALARAIALRPSLLVCDEALSALDAPLRKQHLNLLAQLQEETGAACLFITHDLTSVASFAHRIAVLKNGQIVERGDVAQVLGNPSHPQTQALLAADLG